MEKFFIVRTDVDKHSGVQRVFGVFDSKADAERELVDIRLRVPGVLEIYSGTPIKE